MPLKSLLFNDLARRHMFRHTSCRSSGHFPLDRRRSVRGARDAKRETAMRRRIAEFWTDESGVSLPEYALILALVSVGLLAVLVIFRDSIGWVFDQLAGALRDGVDGVPSYEAAAQQRP